ncbi:carbamate kinase [Lactobacillus xujianguonis]|uniref:Carbamate kinase n=2 Tax=Lactobacillaceae TaxID=33958 RepID=A0A437ST24_9LACO|nr:carbamate kinase [Lactobacillus xujianguonis]RVU72275.1 carbamate kinase [Lactobacillus xujianguonis]
MSKIVVALGGNAIQTSDKTAAGQKKAIKKTMAAIVKMIENGDQIVITHGNGPQVGNLLLQQQAGSNPNNPAMPLDTVGAMTQGSIGYWMQQALDDLLQRSFALKLAVALVTQTVVDPNDPAFKNLSKPIGPFFTKEEVKKEQAEHPNYVYKEDAGRGFRQVVASPKPKQILEAPFIRTLLANNCVPIASGGGGIPVVVDADGLKGVPGVIDKDYSAAKLAENIKADQLVILTTVQNAYLNYGQENEQALGQVTCSQLKTYLAEGQFAPGSMKPKIEAAMEFVQHTGHQAIITSLANAGKLNQGVGTIVTL